MVITNKTMTMIKKVFIIPPSSICSHIYYNKESKHFKAILQVLIYCTLPKKEILIPCPWLTKFDYSLKSMP